MTAGEYMLVFRGQLLDGFTIEQAKENLRGLFKLSHDTVDQLFSLSAVVVKKELSHDRAVKFQQQLQKIGLITLIQPMKQSISPRAAQPSSEDESTAAAVIFSRAAAVAEHATGQQRELPFQFFGRGGEYLRIWVVNILLTIVTLGIYSAWAKVRNHRYFYGNTQLNGHSFEYLASPIAILKGRLIAVGFLIAYMLSSEFMPWLGGMLMLVFIVALPWLVCRAMAFRNYHTRYRNIRFGFDGNYRDALKAFVLWPVAGVLTIGILFPYVICRQKRFLVENTRYGTRHFKPGFDGAGFYAIFLVALGIVVAGVVLMFIPMIGFLFAMAAFLLAVAYVSANTANRIYNHSKLERHGFDSRLVFTRLAFIYFTNGLMILITLTLAMPWAKVRLARYRAECLSLIADGSLDNFIASEDALTGALGEEIAVAFDVDVGL